MNQRCIWEINIDWTEFLIGWFIFFNGVAFWWYAVFQKQYLQAMNKTKEECQNTSMSRCMLIEGSVRFLTLFGYYHVLCYFAPQTLCQYLLICFWIGIVFLVLPLLQSVLWEGKTIQYVNIIGAERLLSLILVTIFFYHWRSGQDFQYIGQQQQEEQEQQQQLQENVESLGFSLQGYVVEIYNLLSQSISNTFSSVNTTNIVNDGELQQQQ